MVPNPIIELGDIKVYLYGVFIAIGIALCILVMFIYTKKLGMGEKLQNFIFLVAIAAIAGGFLFAKLYQALYNYLEDTSKPFDFMGAGITAMGGFIGGALVFIAVYFGIGPLVFKKDEDPKIHIRQFNIIAKVAVCCITIAHAFGRVGCLMGGCCHGAYLGSKYVVGGIWMRAADTGVWGYYVPTQLYEAVFLFALFAVLTLLIWKRFNVVHGVYLIAYGVWRIIIEIFRTDARGAVILGLAPSQWQSVLFIAGGVALFLLFIFHKKIPLWQPYTEEEKKILAKKAKEKEAKNAE